MKSHLIIVNSGKVESVLLWITKDTPISNTQEILRVLEALCQEPGTETNPYIVDKEGRLPYQ